MCSVTPFCIWGIVSRLGLPWTAWQRFLSLFRRDPNFYSPSPPHPPLGFIVTAKNLQKLFYRNASWLEKREKERKRGKKKKKRQPHPKLLEAPGEPVVSALLCHSSQRSPWHVAWSFGLGREQQLALPCAAGLLRAAPTQEGTTLREAAWYCPSHSCHQHFLRGTVTCSMSAFQVTAWSKRRQFPFSLRSSRDGGTSQAPASCSSSAGLCGWLSEHHRGS